MNHCNLTTVASKIRCVGLQEAETPTTPTCKPASVNYFLQAQRRCFKRAQLQVTTRPRALLRRRLEQLLAQVNYLPAAERRPYLQVTTRPRALLRRWLEQLLTHGPLRLGQRISSESGSRNWAQLIGTLPR